MLRLEVEHGAGKARVRCEGALLRGDGPERLSELASTITAESVIIDLAEVPRVDAHGIGVLAAAADRLRRRNVCFTVVNLPPQVRTVVDTCGLSALLNTTADYCSPAA